MADNLKITASGGLNNQDGRIIAKFNGEVETGNTLNNAHGMLGSQQGSFTINTHNHVLVNEKGNIVAAQNIMLESGAIDNRQGFIAASNVALNSHHQTVDNQDTFSDAQNKGIIARDTLMLTTGVLNNSQGNIFSHDRSTINATSLTNHNGKIRAQARLDLNAHMLLQSAGLITANIVNLVAQTIRSNQGSEISGSFVNLTAQTLDNKESKLIARQTADIDVQHGIQNQNGTLASLNKTLLINAHQSELNNAGGIIAAQNGTLHLAANTLDNQRGIIRAHTAKITALQNVDNRNTLVDKAQGIIVTDLNLNAKRINNQAGRITAFNQATLNSTDMQNQSGEILMVKDGMLNSDKINNRAGTIASTAANLSITAQTVLNNRQGNISAVDKLMLNTKGLANQQGRLISSNQLAINTAQHKLDNQDGTIFANNRTVIESGEIHNRQGLIRADSALFIDTHNNMIDNRNTQGKDQGIAGLGSVILQGVDILLNQQGKFYAENSLNIGVQADTDNRQGIMQSGGSLTLSTQKLYNQAGKISAKNTGCVTAHSINNRAVSEKGSLISAGSLTLHVRQLDNQDTKAKSEKPAQGIQGNNVTVLTSVLDNRQGGIYSANNVSITANNRLDNRQGELLAVNMVNVSHNGNLTVNNEKGLIQGNQAIALNAKGLESEGDIKTAGDLNVTLTDSFTLNNAFEASNLTFNTAGNFTNNVGQTVANKMTISANNIVNNVNATLSANETGLNANHLTNRGLIDGSKTLIKSAKVTNPGTGRIYGDRLAFSAKTVENLAETVDGETKAGTIAARNRLDFGVGTLVNRNHALILSLDKLFIGGHLDANHQATGKAALVDNGSATIEGLGDGRITTSKLLNHDMYLQLGINSATEDVEEIALESKPTERYRVGVDGYYGWSGRTAWFTFYDQSKPTISEKQFYVWRYKRTTYTPYIEKQDKAYLNIGGNLSLNGDELHNKYSQMSIGGKLFLGERTFARNDESQSLSADGITLKNEDIEKVIKIDEEGEALFLKHYKKHGHNGHEHAKISDYVKPTYTLTSSFNAVSNIIGVPISSTASLDNKPKVKDIRLETISISAPNAERLDNITVLQTRLADGKQHAEITLTPEINSDEVVNAGQVIAKLHTVTNKTGSQNLAEMNMPIVKTHLADIRLPEASLYKINPEAPNGYLVETDPKFTDNKQWLGSDYLFNALRYDHDNMHKRLGDGFYEQRLINEQVNQLTGRRYIEGYNNDLEQYKALMNSGVKYARRFNLTVGVGLTAKQMSELTTDMVWFVNKEITLKNGKKVTALVPQVYLVARDTDVTSCGAVISANQIFADAGELNNGGVIAGRDLTRLNSNQLENRGAVLGDHVDLSAAQNLVNLGGRIEAVKSLSLSAGKNLAIASTLSSAQSADGNFARTVLDQISTVKVTGEGGRLALHSDSNLTVKAARIESQGSLRATAGEALQITTLTTQNREHYNGDADNYYRLDQKAEGGGLLSGKAGVALIANNNVTLRQTDVSSEKGKVLVGSNAGDITIEAGRAEERLATSIKSTSKGLLSKTTTVSRREYHTTDAVASNVDGQSVVLFSRQGNVTAKGSNVVAERDLSLAAKEKVSILSDVNTHYQANEVIRRKSGLMGSGGIGFTFGSRKETTEQDRTQQSAASSQVGSLTGNTVIRAGNHYQQTGSMVTSREGSVDIVAQSANITAARSDYESNYKYTYEQKGLTVSLTSPVLSAMNATETAINLLHQMGESKNNRINALAGANAFWNSFRAIEAGQVAWGSLGKLSQGEIAKSGVGISLTYGQQKNISTSHIEGSNAISSEINASGKVNISARGNDDNSVINVMGSNIAGNLGTNLNADGDINIEAAKQYHQERSNNKSSGFNAGVAIGTDGIGFTVGGNYGKGYGNGDETTYTYSHIGSQNSQTNIYSGNDVTLKGAQVAGKGVTLTANNLDIESLQESLDYKSKQKSISGSVTVGAGASAAASYSASKMNVHYKSVVEQAGIYAGDGGYQVNVANHTSLIGGTVQSSDEAENRNKNLFSTGTIDYTELKNSSNYDAKGYSLNGGFFLEGNFRIPLGTDSGKQESTNNENSGDNIKETAKDKTIIDTIKGMGGSELSQHDLNQSDKDKTSDIDVKLNGLAGVFSQGNWGVAKALSTAVLGSVSRDGGETGVTTSYINTKNIQITQGDMAENQAKIVALSNENINKTVAKMNVEEMKSELESDLSTAKEFMENLNQIGDKLHYDVEKNEKNLLVKYKLEHCQISSQNCVKAFELNLDELKNRDLKPEEAEILSHMYAHGILNQNDMDRINGAIQYSGKDILNNASVVVRKPYAGLAEEMTFTIFERLRAGIDLPTVFGASNASREQAMIWNKLNSYNAQNPHTEVSLDHVAHSLGASSTKNAMNWAKYQGMNLDKTTLKSYIAGTSYPITNETILGKLTFGALDQGYVEKAAGLFKDGQVEYAVSPRDSVATGFGLPWLPGSLSFGIGNTDTTGEHSIGIPLWGMITGDHTKAYYRDGSVIKFLTNSEQTITDEIKNYQQKTWGQIGPKTKVISFDKGDK
ncbi:MULTISPECIES: hemagglutinin repeat-containing protein [Pasteurellaceae]|uniref:hemagglutinin repeat-containing protein n=1 Tax=Pasteurellaceae TaxID=712 RepID=UPI0035689D18